MKPHKHAELIKAWANGAEIQFYSPNSKSWFPFEHANYCWNDDYEYRIKPEPKPEKKPDEIRYFKLTAGANLIYAVKETANIKIIWDGETGKLKDAEVIA